MATRRRYRRIGIAPPQLVGQLRLSGIKAERVPEEIGVAVESALQQVERSWDEAMRGLQNFLKYIQDGVDDGLPAGAYEDKPESIRAGHEGAVGDSGLGWSPGPHDHQVLTATAGSLGNSSSEGTGEELARADHVHKRDVRVKLDGADVATRNAVDFRESFTAVDDSGNDETDVYTTVRRWAALGLD